MPGRLVDGETVKNYKQKANQAYGEGMQTRLASAATGTNPYANDAELATAWQAGFDYVDGQPLFTIDRNNDQGFSITGTGPTPV